MLLQRRAPVLLRKGTRSISALHALTQTQAPQVRLPQPGKLNPNLLPDARNIPTKEYLDYIERRMMKDGKRALMKKMTRRTVELLYARNADAFTLVTNLYTRYVPYMGVRKGRMADVPVVLGRRGQVVQLTDWLRQHLATLFEKNRTPWRKGKKAAEEFKPAMKERFPTLLAQTLQEFEEHHTLAKKVNDLHQKAYDSRRGLNVTSKRERRVRSLQRLRGVVPGRMNV
eukprot:EG_transcript_23194